MPIQPKYRLITNKEEHFRPSPINCEAIFHRGITFTAKFMGSLEIPRPGHRLEIVAAMRKIRDECKNRRLKKKRVLVEVSLEGIIVSLQTKKRKKLRMEKGTIPLMSHPTHRIFYVSSDSQDLRLFSYIARDSGSNNFRCNVFTSNKKSQAMKIVRTVGQAFEVCHKLAPQNVGHTMSDNMSDDCSSKKEMDSDLSCSTLSEEPISIPATNKAASVQHSTSFTNQEIQQQQLQPEFRDTPTLLRKAQSPLALKHEVLLLKQQLEQQQQQTQSALAEIKLLTGQLAAETAARIEAQARTQQLMVHNKQLLDHIQTLVLQMQELEQRRKPNNHATQPTLAQLMGLPPLPDPEQLNPPLDVYNAARNLQQQYSLLLAQQQSQQNLLPNVLLASLNAATLLPYANHALSDTPPYVTPACRNSPSTFILPLAENDRDSSRDSGLGEVAVDVMRRLDLYSRDSNSNFNSNNPTSARIDCSTDELGGSGRRTGPFITRSTSEKVPHRNDVLAEVQRTAWARHSTK